MAEGMTIALEPKFVIPGTGAVGVEDTLLVTANGMENLTPAPSEIITL
jgi:Xaa-Pro aminopeptidase